jgi:hypothetical protein
LEQLGQLPNLSEERKEEGREGLCKQREGWTGYDRGRAYFYNNSEKSIATNNKRKKFGVCTPIAFYQIPV